MALTKCKKCACEVSTKADKCPKCGAPLGAKQYGCGTLILIVIVVCIFASLFGNYSNNDTGSNHVSKPTLTIKNESYAKAKDLEEVKKLLADLPHACSDTNAPVSTDGTVTLNIICNGADKSMNGIIMIKDGIVKNIR